MAEQHTKLIERLELHVDIHIARVFQQIHLHHRQEVNAQKHQHERDDHALIEPRADGDAHAGRCPKSRGSRHSLDLLPAGDDDRTGGQKADAAVNLCSKAAHVDLLAGRHGDLRPDGTELYEQILAQNAGQRRPEADEHIGAKACRAVLASALKADHAAKGHCQHQPQQHGGNV